MPRLCERPGCSVPADVAYGFDADTLVVWLDRFELDQGVRAGVLCRRHADAMVVPLGWMLDDRREPVPRLFSAARMQDLTDGMARPRPRRRNPDRNGDRTIEMIRTAVMQLTLDDTGNGEGVVHELGPTPLVAERDEPVAVEPVAVGEVAVEEVAVEEPEAEQPEAQVLPWQPRFDPSDDLSGLLRARGRLLSRAFQGLAADGS
ncbi:MAG: hypothetical protein ACK5CE_18630 [Actinomycetes bacterium]